MIGCYWISHLLWLECLEELPDLHLRVEFEAGRTQWHFLQ